MNEYCTVHTAWSSHGTRSVLSGDLEALWGTSQRAAKAQGQGQDSYSHTFPGECLLLTTPSSCSGPFCTSGQIRRRRRMLRCQVNIWSGVRICSLTERWQDHRHIQCPGFSALSNSSQGPEAFAHIKVLPFLNLSGLRGTNPFPSSSLTQGAESDCPDMDTHQQPQNQEQESVAGDQAPNPAD